MSLLTDADLALLREPQLAHLATVDPKGVPHVTPVWIDTDGEAVLFNTAKGRVKYLNIEQNPYVGVSISDHTNDYRTLALQGRAEFVEEGADAHIDFLAKKYLDADSYPFRNPAETRVIVRITPTARLNMG